MVPTESLGEILDKWILLTGNYTSANDAIKNRIQEINASNGFSVKIHAGTVLAAMNNREAISIFESAAKQSSPGTLRYFMALHRLAATEIKRTSSPRSGINTLNSLDKSIDSSIHISDGDKKSLLSVTANLRALAFLKLGNKQKARAEIEYSRRISTISDLKEIKTSESARYIAQQNINFAQILIGEGKVAQASLLLRENLEFCDKNCKEYLSEALSAFAYSKFISHEYDASLKYSKYAIRLLLHETSPTRLKVAREIMVGSLYKVGDRQAASIYMESIMSDPLGFIFLEDDKFMNARKIAY